MELKYAMGNDNFKEIVCSNRTFMELKFVDFDTFSSTSVF